MSYLSLLRFALITSIFTTAFGSPRHISAINITETCDQIASSISSASNVYLPGNSQYDFDNFHWASSSSEASVCSVEPGTPEDVGIILQILGETQTPFGVKGGGHAFNPNFSSTSGVQIALTRFNQINVNDAAQTVEIGTGLIWDEVYESLDLLNLTVIGGRVTGIGVAGFALGGGLSYKTNQYGIATANIVEFELVLPNGTVTTVTADSNPDLFFAVRGAQNNYGIVTSVTMKSISQGLVWGGPITYALNSSIIASLEAAYQDFQENVSDKKAVMNIVVLYTDGELTADAVLFYDAPEPPSGIFDNFLAIPSISSDLTTKTFAETNLVLDGNSTLGERVVFDHRMVENYPQALFNAIINESMFWGAEAAKIDPNATLPYIMEFFVSDYLQHGDSGSWPPNGTASPALLPLCMQWNWVSSENDSWFINAQSQSFDNLVRVMTEEDMPTNLPRYSNYALGSTPVVDIWGEQYLARLQEIQANYDPNNVMGLTGGFKV